MSHKITLYGILLFSLFASLPAAAQQWGTQQQQPQGANLTGAWTESSTMPQGTIAATIAFDPSGNYVMVASQNGQVMRQWGKFSVKQTSQSSAHIELHMADYAPRQICTQMAGMPSSCEAVPPIQLPAFDANFSSPNSFSAQGMSFQRDQQAQLLQVQVPATLVRTLATPVMPYSTSLPYQTPGLSHQSPTGPGSVGAMKYDDEHQQPQRVCGVTGGVVYQTQDGVDHCSTQ
jgi:DNA-binding beta-propeller fold protein YncE